MLTSAASVVIVGAGQAGARAAHAIREAGFGGQITLLGEERHPPYERPELSKRFLADSSAPPFVADVAAYAAKRIDLRCGCPVAAIDRADRCVVLSDGSRQRYDRLLIATGSRVREIDIPGLEPERLLYLRTLDQSRALGDRLRAGATLAVIGGGFIGLEVAATAAALGTRVSLVEAAALLLPRMACPEASALVLSHHLALGIDMHLSARVMRADGHRLILDNGETITADIVVAGVGIVPNSDIAEAAGLACNDGIVVDESGRTTDPFIFAAGDVTRQFRSSMDCAIRLESWQNANSQADVAARSLLGLVERHDEVSWLWSDQGSLNIQSAGTPVAIDEIVVRGGDDLEGGMAVFQLRHGRLVGGVTLNRGADMVMIRRMLARDMAIDARALADPDIPLRRLLREAEAA